MNHLDGEKVLIESDTMVWPDSYIRIEGKGMPVHNSPLEYGSLNVKLKLNLPSRLTDEQRRAVEAIL